MSFIKLDCGLLDSTLWVDREARELFITALLMAKPKDLAEPMAQIAVRSITETGFVVPIGRFGFVEAAGPGIIRRAGLELESGLSALERLGSPDPESRSPEWEGRRLVRVNGGFIALNYDKYRQKDHTAAERSRRYRENNPSRVSSVTSRVTSRSVTQAEAEEEAYTKGRGGRELAPALDEYLQERKWLESLGAITRKNGECIISDWKGATKKLKVSQVEDVFKDAVPGIQWPSEFRAHRAQRGW